MMRSKQELFWKGNFGDAYSSRNSIDIDQVYEDTFGVTRTDLNQIFLKGIKKNTKILEVGCNQGLQLDVLYKMGFKNLHGIDINDDALKIAKKKKYLNVQKASIFELPFKDKSFGLVFTSGVLIHISPKDLGKVLTEIFRVSKRYIWGFEYFSKDLKEIQYRGHKDKLWKQNFVKRFRYYFPELKIMKDRKVRYQASRNIDCMYLLKK